MASAVSTLLTSNSPSSGLNLQSSSTAIAAVTSGMNLQNYLQEEANQNANSPPIPILQPWQEESFRPSTRTIVESVKALNIQDVHWFLHQFDLQKNGGKVRSLPTTAASASMAMALPLTPALTTPTTSTSNALPAPTTSSTGSAPQKSSDPKPSTATAPPAASSAVRKPSPYLADLPSNALQLPTSSPYILDILLDTILGNQAQIAHAEMVKRKQENEAKANADEMDVKLIHLLQPLPPIQPPSLNLPSPQSEHAFQILEALVEAVDIVGVNTLSKVAAIDYLKMSEVPYPINKPDEVNAPEAWTITKDWKKRVALLEEWGAVLDVERSEDDIVEEEEKSKIEAESKSSRRSRSSSSSSSATTRRRPRPSDFLIPPFTPDSRSSQETYLKHIYLLLLEQRQLFLKLVSEVLAKVRNLRAQQNYQLGLLKADVEKRDSKILADIQRFEGALATAGTSIADTKSQMDLDRVTTEKLERQAATIRAEEYQAYRESVAVKGCRLIQTRANELEKQVEQAKERYQHLKTQGVDGLKAIDVARAKLQEVNQQFNKYALVQEQRQLKNDQVKEHTVKMEQYVKEFESAVKQAKKSLKDTKVLVEKSRAQAASLQIVELEITGRAIAIIFANQIGGVSNLFLKFFKCMSGPPDPNDPAPEVVWSPEACAVTELCSPGPTRSASQVANPAWRTVKIDVWKLCEAEYDRYFKVEVWDCDASVKQVASVVRSAIEQAKVDSEQKTKAALESAASSTPPLNPDGTPIQAQPVQTNAVPTQVTLPSTNQIKYQYIGQTVVTLRQLFDAQKKKRAEQEASAAVTTGLGIMTLPVINQDSWATRSGVNMYQDSGQLTFVSVKVVEADA